MKQNLIWSHSLASWCGIKLWFIELFENEDWGCAYLALISTWTGELSIIWNNCQLARGGGGRWWLGSITLRLIYLCHNPFVLFSFPQIPLTNRKHLKNEISQLCAFSISKMEIFRLYIALCICVNYVRHLQSHCDNFDEYIWLLN